LDINLLLKIVGIAIIVTVAHQVLSKSGRDEQATLVSVGGVLVILIMLITEFSNLVTTVRQIFGI
jgi:stage III sporulation protein AC